MTDSLHKQKTRHESDCVKTARKRSGRISNAPTGSGRLLSEQKKSAQSEAQASSSITRRAPSTLMA
ncbi:hypothetical protein ACQKEM_10980, partial [Pseudomonas sp. NPDC077382]